MNAHLTFLIEVRIIEHKRKGKKEKEKKMRIIKIETVNVLISKNNRVIAFQYPGTDIVSQDPLKVRSLQLIVNRWIREQNEENA